MRIVIAPDSFKESLSALEVATAIETGVKRVWPRARCIKLPMADGGEGTVDALVDAIGGRRVRTRVVGPLGEPVRAQYGLLGDGGTAVIEMAAASGLPLVPRARRDPLRTTSYGTGQLIRHALSRGARKIIVGLGGSATIDGGAGLIAALGVRFHDATGRLLRDLPSGGNLGQIAALDVTGLDPRLARTRLHVACDVDNPLTGPRGAAAVFGPQKGATPAMVKVLDRNLAHYGRLLERASGKRLCARAGAGAAGGLSVSLLALTDAILQPGIEIVSAATGLERAMRQADLVITGEGRIDSQTAAGKTPAGVARVARRYRVPVIAIGGGLSDDAALVFESGIDGIEAAIARDLDLDTALAHARAYIANAAERAARLIVVGRAVYRAART